MTDRDTRDSGPDRPRVEPEIIPPGQRARREQSRVFISIDENGATRRVNLAQPGLLTILLALAVFGLIVVALLVVLLSVALIWIPVAIALVVAFVAAATFRQWWHRIRLWWTERGTRS